MKKEKKLINLNCNLIFSICEYLEINTEFDYSSNYKINQKKSKKILGIINSIGAKEYLTPEKTKSYLGVKGEELTKYGINVSFLNYKCKNYPQKNSKNFIEKLSIIDLLFNHGKNSKFFF